MWLGYRGALESREKEEAKKVMVMEEVLREKPKIIIRLLKDPKTVGEIASRLGWDRLRVILILEELSKAGLVERIDTELYQLTNKGKTALERLEAEERLAELPAAFPPKSKPKIIRPEDWIKEWKKTWSYR